MEDNEIKLLIDNKVAEAKLEAAEKRLQTMSVISGILLTIFGIALPIFITIDSRNTSKERVESAIATMENNFNEIKNKQLDFTTSLNREFDIFSQEQRVDSDKNSNLIRQSLHEMHDDFRRLSEAQFNKPDIKCLVGGRTLEGSTITIGSADDIASLEIRNIGEGPTRSIRIKLYTKTEFSYGIYSDSPVGWERLEVNDEPYFNFAYQVLNNVQLIYPKESQALAFKIGISESQKENIPVLLKIYYEQIEPAIYNFTIAVDSKNNSN